MFEGWHFPLYWLAISDILLLNPPVNFFNVEHIKKPT